MYNLSIQGDNFDKRSKVVDLIISAKPKIIIYGISEKDFINPKNSEFKNSGPLLPDIQNIISTKIKPSEYFEFLKIPSSPKDKTWNLIRQINKDESVNVRFSPFPNTPFLKILKSNTIIISDLELKSLGSNIQSFGIIEEPEKNKRLKNLKYMINEIQKNNIKINLFLVPHHEYGISIKSDEFEKSFEVIKNDLINSTEVNIHPRLSEYSKMPIWHDLNHVAVNDQDNIYSNDISKIILKELGY